MTLHNGNVQRRLENIFIQNINKTLSVENIYAFYWHIYRSDKRVIFYVTTTRKDFATGLVWAQLNPYSVHYVLTHVNYSWWLREILRFVAGISDHSLCSLLPGRCKQSVNERNINTWHFYNKILSTEQILTFFWWLFWT